MEPELRHDDRVIVDTEQTNPADGEIVLVNSRSHGCRIIGRIRRTAAGAWLERDNPAFPALLLGNPERFRILGVMVCLICRRARRKIFTEPVEAL